MEKHVPLIFHSIFTIFLLFAWLDPGFERPTCLATMKSSDRTKQSVCGWQYIYLKKTVLSSKVLSDDVSGVRHISRVQISLIVPKVTQKYFQLCWLIVTLERKIKLRLYMQFFVLCMTFQSWYKMHEIFINHVGLCFVKFINEECLISVIQRRFVTVGFSTIWS